MSSVNVFMNPRVRTNAIGGISRVVEAQNKYLPAHGVNVVDSPELADIIALHAAAWIDPTPAQKVVEHCHGLYWHEYKWDHWAYAVNNEVIENIRKADATTVPSEWVANAISRDTWDSIKVIGHGVDLEEWHGDKSAGYVLWNKTREDAVCDPRVVNVLAAAMPRVKFVTTFGDETQNVRVVGTLPYNDHKDYITHSGLYLCTTRETFGIGTLEAMACGVPVVGWDFGATPDIVTHQVHGWLSPVGDYTDLARGIEYCLDNRDRLGQACKELMIREYQWNHIIAQYAELYKDVVSSGDVRVSIIISSYNLKRYLQHCVQSCISQDYPQSAYEIIVVDDCSTDGSYDLAQALAASTPNVRVFKTPRNSNMPGVLNLGVANSRGRYILPLDADNLLPPGALRVLADELDGSRRYDIVYGRVKFVIDDGVTPASNVTGTGDGISSWPPDQFSYEQQMQHRNQIPSTAMYRRSWFEKAGGYRKRCSRIGEDPDFWCRITSLGARPHKITDAITLVYRIRDDSRSNTQPEWAWEEWYPHKGFTVGGPIKINEPIITVVVPVGPGHGEQAIEDCLDSLYAQTMTEWECIVVDDCGDIRWLPSWVRRYTTPFVASGVSVARNIGIANAKGRCFILLDADDYLAPDALEKMYKAWNQSTNQYVYTGWYNVEDGAQAYSIDSVYSPEVLLHNLIHPVTGLYPIQVRNFVKFDEEMRYGEDWDYVLACMANKFCGLQLDEPLVYYRQSSGHNRQQLRDNIDLVRSKVNAKWRTQVMACGCTQKQAPHPSVQEMINSNTDPNMVLLEYVGSSAGSITYTGPATGTSYRFGLSDNNNVKYVRRADADVLLERTEFRLAEPVGV